MPILPIIAGAHGGCYVAILSLPDDSAPVLREAGHTIPCTASAVDKELPGVLHAWICDPQEFRTASAVPLEHAPHPIRRNAKSNARNHALADG